jgi:cytochrome P450/CRP-like cAMP-binding protein
MIDSSQALSSLPRPPQVPGLPLLGQSVGFLLDTSRLLDQLYRTHGPVFRIRAGWNEFTVIAGAEGRDFLNGGAERYLTREAFFKPVGEQLGSSDFVLGVSGEKHERLRRVLSIAYSRQIASPFVPALLDLVAEHTASWSDGAPVRVMPAIHRIAYALYTCMMAGRDLGEHYRDFALLVETNMTVGGRTMPMIAYKNPLYQRARGRILEHMAASVRERRAHPPSPDVPPTILDSLIAVRDKSGQPLNDDEVACYAMYGIAGSCSYMGRLLAFWLYELLRHPAALARVQAEVDGGFQRGLHNATDLRGLSFLRATWHESMRFHPVSQGLPFIASETFAFRGLRIEKGDQVVFSQIPMFRDSPPYTRPEVFEPERCLAPREEHRKGNSYHPFGIGQRSCTAQGLVEVMSLCTMASLVHRFDLSMSPQSYSLRMFAMPLPSPDWRFRVKVDAVRTPSDARARIDEQRVMGAFPGADNPVVAKLLAAAVRRVARPGETLITEGDVADAFYVITEGEVVVDKRDADGVPQRRTTLGPGQFFGERGLLFGTPRSASVRVGDDAPAHLLVLNAEQFTSLVQAEDLVEEEIAALARKTSVTDALCAALPGTSADVLREVLPEFSVETFAKGTDVIRQGDPPMRFYVVCSGAADVLVDGRPATTLGPGQFFGEIGLLLGAPRSATVRASGELVVASTDEAGFNRLLSSSGAAHADLAQAMSERLGRFASR